MHIFICDITYRVDTHRFVYSCTAIFTTYNRHGHVIGNVTLEAEFSCIAIHFRDIAPEGKDLSETNSNLDELVNLALALQESTGIKPLWATCNLFSNPRYEVTLKVIALTLWYSSFMTYRLHKSLVTKGLKFCAIETAFTSMCACLCVCMGILKRLCIWWYVSPTDFFHSSPFPTFIYFKFDILFPVFMFLLNTAPHSVFNLVMSKFY